MTRLIRGEILEPYRAHRLTKSGAGVEVTVTSTALIDESGETHAVATTERPLDQDEAAPPTR